MTYVRLRCPPCGRIYTVEADTVTLDLAQSRLGWHCARCRTTHCWTLDPAQTSALAQVVPAECRADALTVGEVEWTAAAIGDATDRQMWRELEGATR